MVKPKNNFSKILGKSILTPIVQKEALIKTLNTCDALLGKPNWWIIEKDTGNAVAPVCADSSSRCIAIQKNANKKLSFCKKCLLDVCGKASNKEKSYIVFKCQEHLTGITFPIKMEFKTIGFLSACPISQKNTHLGNNTLDLIAEYIQTSFENIRKEIELNKLYESVRPRALALSTIHTVHRLMSSTMDMDDLLPRLARLSLQVLRAKCCSIMILDKDRNTLSPKAIVNTERAAKPKKIKVGDGIIGLVAKTEKAIIRKNVLSVPLIDEELIGVITIKDKQNNAPFLPSDKEILETLAEQSVIAIHNTRLYEEQENLTLGSIKSIAAVLDIKGAPEHRRSERFPVLVRAIGEELKLSSGELRHLYYASLLPEAGKLMIPKEILTKSTPLKKSEFDIIKHHPVKGAEIIEPLRILQPVMPIIMYHHEKWDGTGYPEGLKGEKIPIGARILAVAETFEAMLRKKPYRTKKISPKNAIEEIKKNSGSQFDPKVVKAFLNVYKKGRFKMYIENLRNDNE